MTSAPPRPTTALRPGVAYLVNQYPKVSHSFIRREIQALEALGVPVKRFSLRRCGDELVDPADVEELGKTRFVLAGGLTALALATLRVMVRHPVAWLRTLRLTLALARKGHRGLPYFLAYMAEACRLLEWLADEPVGHVHAHFGTNSTTVALLCRELGGPPYSFTVHGPEEFDGPAVLSLDRKIDRAAFVVVISSFGRSQIFRWCPHDQWPKIHVVHCAVDDAFLEAPPTPVPDDPQLVCVGRLCEQKGPFVLLDAAARLAREGYAFGLTLVGDGELRPEVERLIDRLDLADRVRITGWATGDAVREHLLAARALILPSFAEGLPVVIMEALALGRPVVSTYVAGIPELVVPGACGWLVPAGDAERLADAMRSVLDASPRTLQELGERGRERVARRHRARTEAEKLARLFGAAGGGSPCPAPPPIDAQAPEVLVESGS